jgi:hypothetical protein
MGHPSTGAGVVLEEEIIMSAKFDRTEQLHEAEAAATKARDGQHARERPAKDAEKPAVGHSDRTGEDDLEGEER